MATDLAYYIVRFYGHLMTDMEAAAYLHLQATQKMTSDTSHEAQLRAMEDEHLADHSFRRFLSEDPVILNLARDGRTAFEQRVAERLLREHPKEIYINRCPECGALLPTPVARFCGCGYSAVKNDNQTKIIRP